MIQFVPSPRERLLLTAALSPDGTAASESWREWSSQITLESAPVPELRLLTAVYEHLSAVAPELRLPEKLRGKARATFTRNQVIASSSLPAIAQIYARIPVVIAKGLAFCARFGAWSSRQMGDADIYVPFDQLEVAVDILAGLGWVPKYGLTWNSLKHRTSLRRNSWNSTKGHGDIDLHWRVQEGADEAWLDQAMREGAVETDVLGHHLRTPSPEFAAIMSLNHGFVDGTRGDAFQAIVDCAKWLPICDAGKLGSLLSRAGRWDAYDQATAILAAAGRPHGHIARPAARQSPSANRPTTRPEVQLLLRPRVYRLWERLGRPSALERLLLRTTGPFSRPLGATGVARADYDLRDCTTIDELAGPGWGWPEPEHTCFWTDRADCRLLVPLGSVGDHLIVLTLSKQRGGSPNRKVLAFANGHLVTVLDLANGRLESEYVLIVPRRQLSGPWVELSFRPLNYLGDAADSVEDYALRRSLPTSRLRVFDADHLADVLASSTMPLVMDILRGEQPHAARFDRIRAKIAASTYRNDPLLPVGFNPVLYVLSYPDLLEAEVDPYEHFVIHGRHEGRAWH